MKLETGKSYRKVEVETVGWSATDGPTDGHLCRDTHRITFDLIDGKPDCASIKMEELK